MKRYDAVYMSIYGRWIANEFAIFQKLGSLNKAVSAQELQDDKSDTWKPSKIILKGK